MAISLNLIDADNDIIADGPATLNQNFQAIQQHINDLEEIVQTGTSVIKLTNKATIPNNSIEADSLTLVLASGNSFIISPDGGAATASIAADGKISGLNITVTGVGVNASTLGDATFTGTITAQGQVSVGGLLKLNNTNSRVARKYRTVAVSDANIGGAATNPIAITYDDILYLNYNNGGALLGGDADVKLDTSLLEDGQIIKIVCLRKNVGDAQRLNNGSTGTEVFAYIDPNGIGFQTISSAVKPAFTPQASPNNQSYMIVQWTNIGGGNYRLVILESVNVTGVV